jgi:hypothetical protein
MKKLLYAAVLVIMDVPDDDAAAAMPWARNPLDELAERLRREMQYGRRGPIDVSVAEVPQFYDSYQHN